MDRAALIAERDDIVRKRNVRIQSNQPHAAWMAKADQRIEEIDAQLDAPEPKDDEPTATLSLAGKTLGDPDATATEKSLAASVLARSGD